MYGLEYRELLTEARGGSTDFHVLWVSLENVCYHVGAHSKPEHWTYLAVSW